MCSCPFADIYHDGGRDKHPSFGINLETGSWNCYVCNDKGGKGKSIQSLAVKLEVDIPSEMADNLIVVRRVRVNEPTEFADHLIDVYSSNPEAAYEELKPRGISLEAIKTMKVGKHPRMGSLYFPDIDMQGNLNGVVARNALWDGRYGFELGKKREMLFGAYKPLKTCYLVEGPTDALKLITWGYDAVASFGNMISKQQGERLLLLAKTFVLVPDQDKAAERWLKDAKRRFKGNAKTYQVDIAQCKDVGEAEYTKEMFEADRKKYEFLY
jgi:hypothetical protein